MNSTPHSSNFPHLLVAGAGFLGLELMRQARAKGFAVSGIRRFWNEQSSRNQLEQQGCQLIEADLTEVSSLEQLGLSPQWVIHAASTRGGDASLYAQVYREGIENLYRAFPQARLGFTSSTSVFGQSDESWVDEQSPTEPSRATSRTLLEAEAFTLARGGTVLRLSGLYGNERSVLVKKFLEKTAVIERETAERPSRYLNQIHVEDATSAWLQILHASQEQTSGEVFNASDGNPMTQREVQQVLAEFFEQPLPPLGEADPRRKRGLTNKRIRAEKLKALGWQPRYPSFAEALHGGGIELA